MAAGAFAKPFVKHWVHMGEDTYKVQFRELKLSGRISHRESGPGGCTHTAHLSQDWPGMDHLFTDPDAPKKVHRLRQGRLLLRINGHRVGTKDTLKAAFKACSGSKVVQITLAQEIASFEAPPAYTNVQYFAKSAGVAWLASAKRGAEMQVIKRFSLGRDGGRKGGDGDEDGDTKNGPKDGLRELCALSFFQRHPHPNVLSPAGAWLDRDCLYLATPRYEMTLRQWLTAREAPPYAAERKEAFRPLAQALLGGLDHLHQANMIHRDIKPENVLVRPQDLSKACFFDYDTLRNPEQYFTEKEERQAQAKAKRKPPRLTPSCARDNLREGSSIVGTPGYSDVRAVVYGKEWDRFSTGALLFETLKYPDNLYDNFDENVDYSDYDINSQVLYQEFVQKFKKHGDTGMAQWLIEKRGLLDLGDAATKAEPWQVELIAALIHPKTTGAGAAGLHRRATVREALEIIGVEPDETPVPEFKPRMPASKAAAHIRAVVRAEVKASFDPDTGRALAHPPAPAAAAPAPAAMEVAPPAPPAKRSRSEPPRRAPSAAPAAPPSPAAASPPRRSRSAAAAKKAAAEKKKSSPARKAAKKKTGPKGKAKKKTGPKAVMQAHSAQMRHWASQLAQLTE